MQARRVAIPLGALLLVVAVLATDRPDKEVQTATGAGMLGVPTSLAPSSGTGAGQAQSGGTTDGSFDAEPSAASTPGATDATSGSAGPASGSSGATSPVPTIAEGGDTPPPAPGTSRTGVVCDGTNRQLPESSYGPLCVPQFTGDNGGETAFGVTAEEITVTYRITGSAQEGALTALGGSALESVGLDQRGIANDMQVLVDYFNERFELYGRKVNFVVYEGQGDILQEYQGRSQQGAQADAARAKDLGAFADVSYAGQSQLYAEAAASNEIVVFSPIYLTRNWHQSRAPYSHSPMWPPTEDGARFQANVVCGALHPGKADRSNDPAVATQDRVFGIVHPENPEYARIGELLEAHLNECGAPVGRRIAYALDVAQASQSTNVVAQLRAAGVTTVLCACDFLAPQLFMQSANQQAYTPEWFLTFHWSDPFYRTYPENQFSGQLVAGGVTEPFMDTEPGQVFRAATDGGTPESVYTYDKVYQQIFLLFSGLQAAGPNLTPESMWVAMQSLPTTLSGAIGPWEFGAGPSMPRRWYALGVYDPEGRNTIDDEPGASIACFGGRYFRFDDIASVSGTLDCPL